MPDLSRQPQDTHIDTVLFWWVTLGACAQMTRIQPPPLLTKSKLKLQVKAVAGRAALLASHAIPLAETTTLRLGWYDSSPAQACLTATNVPNTFSVISVLLRWDLYGFLMQFLQSFLSEGYSDVYLAQKVPLFSRLPPPKLKEITTKHLLLSLYTTLRIT